MNERKPCIAVVDDDPAQRQLLENALQRAGYATLLCKDGGEALAAAPQCDLMLLDVRLPVMSGLDVLERLRVETPALPIILLTAFIDVRDAVRAMKMGARDYLEKPIDLDEVIAAVDDALGAAGRSVSEGNAFSLPDGVVAESAASKHIFAQAARAAQSDVTVLILGESGTGKEVVAEFIHAHCARAQKPFVRVNSGAIPETLIESELFGHERGAFTGADARRIGRFEEAEGGTVFLDEIGELPLALQPKLLHVLEGGGFRRLGGAEELRANVRVIAATNRVLEDELKRGTFREDLYYRLNVIALHVPPLRERTDDLLPFAERFLHARRQHLAPATERALLGYSWPGNFRELRNALERASVMASGTLILPTDLPPHIRDVESAPIAPGSVLVGDMQEIQRRAILEALERTGGNKTQAANVLGISRRNLIYKLREYGM